MDARRKLAKKIEDNGGEINLADLTHMERQIADFREFVSVSGIGHSTMIRNR